MARMQQKSRWLEIEAWLLVLLVTGVYFTRMTTLSIRGEESRRARVAYEMLHTGDWIVPRQQGELFLDRPPLQNWVIAVAALAVRDVNSAAVRLPSAVATLLTTLLIYGYSRSFLSRLGALGAGMSFATMAQVLELGGRAETEAVFTLLVSGSLLLWHFGYAQGWPPMSTWVIGYILAALGALAKGPQAPIYFIGSVWIFLLLKRHWRYLNSWSHAAGLFAFVTVLGAWQIPFYLQLGWHGVQQIWLSEVAKRFSDRSLATVVTHLATYPFEILSCMLPWSLLLACFLIKGFRQSIGLARPAVLFLGTCLLVTFPSVWISPGARGRYFMPLYPCVAPLIGLVIQRCYESGFESSWRRVWTWYLRGLGVITVIAGLGILGASLLAKPGEFVWAQPPMFAWTYVVVAVGTAGVIVWASLGSGSQLRWRAGILALAGFLGLTYSGVMINMYVNASVDTEVAVARLKRQLPKGHRLVSLGLVHHLFAYYYRDPITPIAWPSDGRELNVKGTYFCFNRFPSTEVTIPFAWEEAATVSVARYRSQRARSIVVIGRRLPAESVR